MNMRVCACAFVYVLCISVTSLISVSATILTHSLCLYVVQIQLRPELSASLGDQQSADYMRGSQLDSNIHQCMIDCLKVNRHTVCLSSPGWLSFSVLSDHLISSSFVCFEPALCG